MASRKDAFQGEKCHRNQFGIWLTLYMTLNVCYFYTEHRKVFQFDVKWKKNM